MGGEGLAEGKKNATRRQAWIVFEDESGISLEPPIRATWSPKGKTPVMRYRFNWKRASMAAALCYRPDGSKSKVVFQIRPGSYNDDGLIEFLKELHRFLRGEKVVLLWDRLPSHRSAKMKKFISSQRHWLMVERMPAYAPDLNPTEGFWANLKGKELANRASDTMDEAIQATKEGVTRIRRRSHLAFAFLRKAGLSL